MQRDHHVLWEVSNGETTTMCVMVSCCAGAELQVVRAVHGDEEIILRELYPDRSSLYERARELHDEARAARGEEPPRPILSRPDV
jgi:hypothetical protein